MMRRVVFVHNLRHELIELPRTTLVQDRDGLCVKINARPDDPGVRISEQQLDNWCVKQYRENIMKPAPDVKAAA